jgi:hypothetical protein
MEDVDVRRVVHRELGGYAVPSRRLRQCSGPSLDVLILPAMERVLRGWNGTLVLSDESVVVKRGIRGLLVRKGRQADVETPFTQVAVVRYAPAGGVGGYLQIIQRGSSRTDDYLATIRDSRTVTFATRSGRWRRIAEEIADLAGAPLEAEPAAPYWRAVFGASRRR